MVMHIPVSANISGWQTPPVTLSICSEFSFFMGIVFKFKDDLIKAGVNP